MKWNLVVRNTQIKIYFFPYLNFFNIKLFKSLPLNQNYQNKKNLLFCSFFSFYKTKQKLLRQCLQGLAFLPCPWPWRHPLGWSSVFHCIDKNRHIYDGLQLSLVILSVFDCLQLSSKSATVVTVCNCLDCLWRYW